MMMSKGVDEALRAQAVGPGVPAAAALQGEAPHGRLRRDVGSRARKAGAGAARHDLAAAREEEAAAHDDREAIRALRLAPGLHAVARMAETDRDHVRATHTLRNQCSQQPKLRKDQAMDPQKALRRRTYNSISHRRRRQQPRTPIQTFPRAHHHSPAGSTLGTQLSHLHRPHLRIIKANGHLRHLHHHTLLPRQATTARNNHLRAGSHRITPQAGLRPRALLRPRGVAVGRLRLHLTPLKDTQSSSSSSQGVSNMAGAGMVAVGTGVEAVAAVAAVTAEEEDGDRF